jgi:26S proteasome regulatory subunit N10
VEPLYRCSLAIKEAVAAGAAGGEFGGVDPNIDPELATALRVSMEEQHARHESEASQAPEPLSTVPEALDAAPAVAAPTDAAPTATPVAASAVADASSGGDEMDDGALLRQALALSMNDNAECAGKLDDEVRTGILISSEAQMVGSN